MCPQLQIVVLGIGCATSFQFEEGASDLGEVGAYLVELCGDAHGERIEVPAENIGVSHRATSLEIACGVYPSRCSALARWSYRSGSAFTRSRGSVLRIC